MKDNELDYYSSLANWDFSRINYTEEDLSDWDFFEQIKMHTNDRSLCLDIGTGGGEKALTCYPAVGMLIATDFSPEMIRTAKENAKSRPDKNVKFCVMDNRKMRFPDGLFDLISARHTEIDAKQIYNCLTPGGAFIVEGVDSGDCKALKDLFKKGQGYFDKVPCSVKDRNNIITAGFSSVELTQLNINEYYKTREDLLALLLKTPILDDYSKTDGSFEEHIKDIDRDVFDEYVKRYTTEKGILLERVLYGIAAIK